MIRLALLTADQTSAQEIAKIARRSPHLDLTLIDGSLFDLAQLLHKLDVFNVEVLLIDSADLDSAAQLTRVVQQSHSHVGVIALTPEGTPLAHAEAFGAHLTAPFDEQALDEATHQALHALDPCQETKMIAFLPSKAGAGCSTVALNAAARLSENRKRRSLLMECDRHSGILSILLDVEDEESGLSRALQGASKLTASTWRENLTQYQTLDLLLANSGSKRAGTNFPPTTALPSWADYYHLLKFVGPMYDTITADLPEVINPATAEVVNCAHSVFIVCEPEMPSVKLAARRREHLEAAQIPREKIHLVVTRWERDGLKQSVIESVAGCPVFAKLPNDFREIKDCSLEGRVASDSSAFGKASIAFAAQLHGLLEGDAKRHSPSRLGLLSRFGLRMTG